jgi:hypothetical protein
MQGESLFDLLPDELLLQIMLHCAPAALLSSELVCRRWRAVLLSGGGAAWLTQTRQLWNNTGWVHNVARSCPLMQRLSQVPVNAMRRALVGYDTAGLVEKYEWMRLLRAKLLWEPFSTFWTQSERGRVAPVWALNIEDCKAAWLFATEEIAREVPLEGELLRQKWDLIFHADPAQEFEIEFFADRTMTSSSHPGASFRWSLQTRDVAGMSGLQIENFPLHCSTRSSEGLWQMRNAYVSIIQRPPPPGDLPLFSGHL